MKTKKFLIVLTVFLMTLSLFACSTSKGNKKDDDNLKTEIAALMATEPNTKDEAAELHKKLMEQENAILSKNSALWEKVFLSADKGMAMIEDGGNYGDFLIKTMVISCWIPSRAPKTSSTQTN